MGDVIRFGSKGISISLREGIESAVGVFMRRGGYSEEYRALAIERAVESTSKLSDLNLQLSVPLPDGLQPEQVATLDAGIKEALKAYHQAVLLPVATVAVGHALLSLSLEVQAKAHGLDIVPRKDL